MVDATSMESVPASMLCVLPLHHQLVEFGTALAMHMRNPRAIVLSRNLHQEQLLHVHEVQLFPPGGIPAAEEHNKKSNNKQQNQEQHKQHKQQPRNRAKRCGSRRWGGLPVEFRLCSMFSFLGTNKICKVIDCFASLMGEGCKSIVKLFLTLCKSHPGFTRQSGASALWSSSNHLLAIKLIVVGFRLRIRTSPQCALRLLSHFNVARSHQGAHGEGDVQVSHCRDLLASASSGCQLHFLDTL